MLTKSKEEVVQEFRIQSIREATMRVIARKGMSAATMQEIADEAGVAKGTIYLYFRDRDELVEKTFEHAIGELHARLDAAMAADVPFDVKFRQMVAAKFEFFSQNREFFRLYVSLRLPEGSPQQQRRQKRTCHPQYQVRVEKLTSLLEEAMARGEVRRLNARRLAIILIEGSNALAMERVMEESAPPAAEDVELVAGVLLDGISIRKSKRSTH